ncbi:MAG: cysteine-rich CWC family protein [Proteobacteria bacterium]|nr:cysteine-rich CWC family protein [Pseudomonadota bacterium]
MVSPCPAAPSAPSLCPRCGAAFGCGAAQPGCACGQVRLTAAQRADLATRYQGCLCMACLRALAAPDARAQ